MRSTFRIETGNGKSFAWEVLNNPGGIKCGTEYCVYKSKEDGKAALETLLEEYVSKYGYNLKAIRDRYCQCGGNDLEVFEEIFEEELRNEKA